MGKKIFPIITIPNIVLFPRTEIVIFITKSSQIKLVTNCINNSTKFILAQGVPKEEESDNSGLKTYISKEIATIAIPSSPLKIANNTLKFTVRGEKRIILKRLIQDIPYSTFEVEYLDDWEEEITFHQSVIGRLKKILFSWIDNYVEDSLEKEKIIDNISGISDLAFLISNYIIDDPVIKQIILEERSLVERIKITNSLLKPENPFHLDPIVVKALKSFKKF